MRVGKRLGIPLVIFVTAILICSRGQRFSQARDVGWAGADVFVLPYVGVPSCSARSCHGADSPDAEGRLLRNEYTTWVNSDPHAVAYGALFGSRARDIMKNLAPSSAVPGAAHQDIRCLACHCEPQVAAQATLASRRADGVGCEACHGLARTWLDPHTAQSTWDKLSATQKQQFGMTNVKDPAVMAQACVGCHVGAPANAATRMPLRDVDHNLLAAGHPRLDFEFATFLANIPAHWKQVAGSPDAQRRESAKYWAVGQTTSARAALALLADRAARASASNQLATWPEFAEFDCSSCHHALTTPSARQRRPEGSRPLGGNSWGNWYLSMPSRLLAEPDEAKTFAELKKHLERPYPPLPTTAKLVEAASGALSRIEQRTSQMSDQQLVSRALERLRQTTPPPDRCCWELAEQMSLSAALMERAHSPEKKPAALATERSRANDAVFGKLAFPPGTDGQGAFHWDESFERDLRALLSPEPPPK